MRDNSSAGRSRLSIPSSLAVRTTWPPRAFITSRFSMEISRDAEDDVVPHARARQRQCDSGVAGGRLDDRAALDEFPIALGALDHSDADTVFDRERGIVETPASRRDRPSGTGMFTSWSIGVLPTRSRMLRTGLGSAGLKRGGIVRGYGVSGEGCWVTGLLGRLSYWVTGDRSPQQLTTHATLQPSTNRETA